MSPLLEHLRLGLEGMGEIFFPPLCSSCLKAAQIDRLVCDGCLANIKRYDDPICLFCEQIGWRKPACNSCGGTIPLYAAGDYCEPLKSIVLKAKFHGVVTPLRVLADLLVEQHQADFSKLADAHLVPVPLHFRRQSERGYNQAALIAEALAQVVPGWTVDPLLVRTIHRRPQARLNQHGRASNISGVFSIREFNAVAPSAPLLLVDDIVTTGSTAREAIAVLDAAGFSVQAVLALAHGN